MGDYNRLPGVEVYPVEGTYTPGGSICEEFAVEEHHPADEVESEEHREGESNIVRHPLPPHLASFVGQLGRPEEVVLPGYGVDRADGQLRSDLGYPLPGHRYPPVVCTVIDHKQLEQTNNN